MAPARVKMKHGAGSHRMDTGDVNRVKDAAPGAMTPFEGAASRFEETATKMFARVDRFCDRMDAMRAMEARNSLMAATASYVHQVLSLATAACEKGDDDVFLISAMIAEQTETLESLRRVEAEIASVDES